MARSMICKGCSPQGGAAFTGRICNNCGAERFVRKPSKKALAVRAERDAKANAFLAWLDTQPQS